MMSTFPLHLPTLIYTFTSISSRVWLFRPCGKQQNWLDCWAHDLRFTSSTLSPTLLFFPGDISPNVSDLITSFSSLTMPSVTSSTTTMVNSLPQPSPPAVSSQSSLDSTNSELPSISSPSHHNTSIPTAITTSAFAALSLSTSSTVSSSVPSSTLLGKVNVSNSLADTTTASHGPLIMSAQSHSEVSYSCMYFLLALDIHLLERHGVCYSVARSHLLYEAQTHRTWFGNATRFFRY